MFYTEDTTTREELDKDHDDKLLILDGTARLDYFDKKPEIEDKTRLQGLLDFIRNKF